LLEKIEKYEDLLERCTVATFDPSINDILLKMGFKKILSVVRTGSLKRSHLHPREAIFKRDERYMKRVLKRCDLIICDREERFVSKIASNLGIPFITRKVITVILPDGYDYDDLNIERFKGLEFNTDSSLLVKYLQAFEAFKVLTGAERPTFAPMAIKINEKIEMIDLIKSRS
jgi:hypothetical protein